MKLSEAIRKGRAEDGKHITIRMFEYEGDKIVGSCAMGYALYAVLTPEERTAKQVRYMTDNSTVRQLFLERAKFQLDQEITDNYTPCSQCGNNEENRKRYHQVTLFRYVVDLNDSMKKSIDEIITILEGLGF